MQHVVTTVLERVNVWSWTSIPHTSSCHGAGTTLPAIVLDKFIRLQIGATNGGSSFEHGNETWGSISKQRIPWMAEQLNLPRRTELHGVRWFLPDRRSNIVLFTFFSDIFLIAVRGAVTAGCSYIARFLLCYSQGIFSCSAPNIDSSQFWRLQGE
jgi:hypothetical protein